MPTSSCLVGAGACGGCIGYEVISGIRTVILHKVKAFVGTWFWTKGRSAPRIRRLAELLDIVPNEFPKTLGPFALEVVPYIGELYDSKFHDPRDSSESFNESSKPWAVGWSIRAGLLRKKCGVESTSKKDKEPSMVRLPLSQVAEIEFGVPRRRRLRIPEDATQLRWVYPLLQKGAIKQHDIELAVSEPQVGSPTSSPGSKAEDPAVKWKWADQVAVISFLEVGGWMLLDKDNQVSQILVPVPTQFGDRDALEFTKCKWCQEWTTPLRDRWHEVTLDQMVAVGAKFFTWLSPGELVGDGEEQPKVPYGGFAYIFHDIDDTSPGAALARKLDCYFAVAEFRSFDVSRHHRGVGPRKKL